ncbi:MAG: DUF5518 domain-containing protein, partial [Sphingobacteriales bacterium]
ALLSVLSYYFIKGWYNVIPWAIAALIVGYLSESRRNSLINGAVFGYFLFVVYIVLGYTGKTDTASIIKFILFTLLFNLVGSVACAAGAFVGNLLKRLSEPLI